VSQKITIGFYLKGTIKRRESAITVALGRKGCFILATNALSSVLSNEEMLREYKAQSLAEKGVCFIKDPWFMVDSIFLKKNERIQALMFVMTLCLVVYTVGEYRLRQQLQQTQQTLPNQLGKAI
jgi:transposase